MAEEKPPDLMPPEIEWHVDPTMPARYVTNIVVQALENECLVQFFEIAPPILIGEPSEITAKIKAMKSIRAECVGRVYIALNKMPEFIEALKMNYERRMNLQIPGKESK